MNNNTMLHNDILSIIQSSTNVADLTDFDQFLEENMFKFGSDIGRMSLLNFINEKRESIYSNSEQGFELTSYHNIFISCFVRNDIQFISCLQFVL